MGDVGEGWCLLDGLNIFLDILTSLVPLRLYIYSPNMLKPAFGPHLQVIFDILLFLGIWKLKVYINMFLIAAVQCSATVQT